MSINGHNGPHPDSLRKMYGQLKTMAKEARRSIAKRRNRVYVGNAPKLPRMFCDVCAALFDYASTPGEPKPPEKSRCGGCRGMLVNGYTAFTSKHYHAFLKPGPTSQLKVGQVYFVTDEQMTIVQKRFKEQQPNGQNPPPEA